MPTISYSGFGFYHPGNIIDYLVELWTENPRVGGSIPPLGTTPFSFCFITNHLDFKSVPRLVG